MVFKDVFLPEAVVVAVVVVVVAVVEATGNLSPVGEQVLISVSWVSSQFRKWATSA